MENKPLIKRVPWWGWIIIVILGLGFLGSLITSNKAGQETQSQKQTNSAKQKSISREMEQKVERLRMEMVGNLNKEVGNMFTNSYLQHIYENDFKLTLTVKDNWYYLKEFQQERLLEDAWQYFNSLGVKYDLRNPNDLPWRVILVDKYDKEVAKRGW